MESGLSASDIALLGNDGMAGGNSFLWIFALLILANGGFGFGNNGRGYTDATTNEILSGQKFEGLSRQINATADGICSSTYALNNAIKDGNSAVAGTVVSEGRSLQNQLFEMQSSNCANTQRILDAITTSKVESMQNRINQLELQNAVSGVVRYPMATTYTSGANPFCSCNCNGI